MAMWQFLRWPSLSFEVFRSLYFYFRPVLKEQIFCLETEKEAAEIEKYIYLVPTSSSTLCLSCTSKKATAATKFRFFPYSLGSGTERTFWAEPNVQPLLNSRP